MTSEELVRLAKEYSQKHDERSPELENYFKLNELPNVTVTEALMVQFISGTREEGVRIYVGRETGERIECFYIPPFTEGTTDD